MDMSDMEKLKVLLPHWVEHNTSHNGDFTKWAEKAAAEGRLDIQGELLEAVDLVDRANAALERASDLLGAEVS